MPRPIYSPPKRPYLYLPDGWSDAWLAAKAGVLSGGQARLLFLGDSVMAGVNASDWRNSIPETVRTSLEAAGYPTFARGFHAYGDGENAGGGGVNAPWSGLQNGVATTLFAQEGLGMVSFVGAGATAVAHQTLTTPIACTQIDLYYVDLNAGTWQYKLDGAANVTVTTTLTNTLVKISLTGLANTTHTVAVGWQSKGNELGSLYAVCYPSGPSAAGIGYARYANSGWQASQMVGLSGSPQDQIRLWSGVNPLGDGTALLAANLTAGFPTQPHLAIVEFGLNDTSGAKNPDDYLTVLERYTRAFRAGVANASVLFVIAFAPDTFTSDVGSGGSTFIPRSSAAFTYARYVGQIYDLARLYNCAVVSFPAKWGSLPFNAGLMPASGPHPTDAGYADMATEILSVI